MELLNTPQIHSTFASLGSTQGETYVINDDCLAILEEILCKLAMEDTTLRTYRRAIGFGQNIKKDIIPLILNTRDNVILDMVIRLMVNLTVPIECLLSVDVMTRTEIGRHTIYELNRLLYTSKEVFVDLRVTKAIIDHIKGILETSSHHKQLSLAQCDSVNNSLLLFRNILHIPENTQQPCTSMQNQIIWNLFTQSLDKILIHLMSCSQRALFNSTIVQLIALMYKDQHVGTLQKMLNHWSEAVSHTESSDDNESNTSPPNEFSGDSSPMLTSDPTSDSSDNCSGNMMSILKDANLSSEDSMRISSSEYPSSSSAIRAKQKVSDDSDLKACSIKNSLNSPDSNPSSMSSDTVDFQNKEDIVMKSSENTKAWAHKSRACSNSSSSASQKHAAKKCSKQHSPNAQSELSDCGYGTQVSQGDQNQESISTSSNDDDSSPKPKPAHQKPPSTNQKQRFNAAQKQRNGTSGALTQEKKDARRKKLIKRSKSSIINMKGLIHHTPSDEDISNILKEFTVDFLLKGYGCLVADMHAQLLSDMQLSIDTSHFYWLVTYFLKFAAQLELDLEHINSVLCFDIVSYLTYEGVNLCEQLELISRQQGTDLKPHLRRIHLVVTAIREFLQALEVYKNSSHLSSEDSQFICNLQTQISCTEDLRNLFVLLLRLYNPSLQSRQYLQDLIVTNHLLLLLLDNANAKQDDNKCRMKMVEHITQFATVEIIHQYGILLENFRENGEFVNDCCFTLMHHIAGELEHVSILFQPNILKTYSQIWETEYEICDDWSDLIEYVIHKFINTPPKPQIARPSPAHSDGVSINDLWAQEEMDTLYWYFVQSKKKRDIVGHIIKQIKDSGQKSKSRMAVIQQLLQQDIISLVEYDDLMKFETQLEDSQYEREAKNSGISNTMEKESGFSENSDISVNNQPDDIKVLRDRLLKENKGMLVTWLQRVLIECCFIKLKMNSIDDEDLTHLLNENIMEPIPHHCILKKQSIPLVPYNSEQHKILVYQPFVLLLHKLGFHLPADANKLFVRIPEFWTWDILLNVAEKLGPIPQKNLKFDIDRIRKAKKIVAIPADETCATMSDAPVVIQNQSVDYANQQQSWLQMVVQTKTTAERMLLSQLPQLIVKSSPSETVTKQHHRFRQPSTPKRHSAEKSECDVRTCSENSSLIHDEVIDLCETHSASSLTRMYVSGSED